MDYALLNTKAGKTIKDLGFTVSVTRPNGTPVGDAHAVVSSSEAKVSTAGMPGSTTVETSKTIYMTAPNQTFTPKPGDVVIAGSSRWTIDTAEVIKPANIVVAWKLGVK